MTRAPALAVLTLSALLLALPVPRAVAQGWTPPMADEDRPLPEAGSTDEGMDMIGRGMDMLMENLMRDLGPDLDRLRQDMSGALNSLSPVVGELAALVDDIGNYQAPQRLENGDILIRRKPGAPRPPALPFGAPGQDSPPIFDPDAPEYDL